METWFGATASAALIGVVISIVSAANSSTGHFHPAAARAANTLAFFTIDSTRTARADQRPHDLARADLPGGVAGVHARARGGRALHPYPFIDVGRLGYGAALVNCVWVALLFCALGAGAAWLDRRLSTGRADRQS